MTTTTPAPLTAEQLDDLAAELDAALADATSATQGRRWITGKQPPLTPEQFQALGRDLDAVRERVIGDLGERDANYIRNVSRAQRAL